MTTAVILAAGMGTRLRDAHVDMPKGFVEMDGRPIVESSILHLDHAGINDIVIVTGYAAEYYHKLALRYDGLVRVVHNPEYADSGSMYSLYCTRDVIDEGFLLLESDLIYEPRALDVLLGSETADAVLLSGPTNAGDEVFVEAPEGLLVNMSKDRSTLSSVAGELVGISKISRGLFALMKHIAHNAFKSSLNFDYETDCLIAAAARWDIACPVINDLIWAEIDDPEHLRRAQEDVWPRLK
jgi:2-aminoethylphosphonate-pyruvate transaminase